MSTYHCFFSGLEPWRYGVGDGGRVEERWSEGDGVDGGEAEKTEDEREKVVQNRSVK